MRVVFTTVVVLFSVMVWGATSAHAQAQALTIGDCELWYSTILRVADDSGKPLRTEFRRNDQLPIEVRCKTVQLFALELDFFEVDQRFEMRGDVVFQQEGTRIVAKSGRFDLKTRNGVFETATGSLQLTDRQVDRSLFGSLEPEALFTAARIEKVGPRKYVLTDATFTTCVQPTRRWQVISSKMSFTVDRYAIMTNARLEVKDVPLLYLPVFYYPIQEDDRATGLLMPTYGTSNIRGFTLSNAFFWAINRSQDLTIYHDWFSRSGQGFGADYRYVGHDASNGDVRLHMINERAIYDTLDPTKLVTPAKRSYEVRGNLSQQLPGRIRLTGQADFFTDATTQQIYQTDLSVFTRRSSYFRLAATGNWGRISGTAFAERRDYFNNTITTSVRTQPRVNINVAPAPIAGTKIYVGGSFDTLSYAQYSDLDKPETLQTMFRTDGNVFVRAPYSLGPALTLEARVSARQTNWSAFRDPLSGQRVDQGLGRTLLEGQLTLTGPKFSRIFNTEGNRWVERLKHVITPTATVTRRSAFERFNDVLVFDSSVDSIVGGVTQLSYGISNELLARVRQKEGDPIVTSIATLDVSQRYYTDQRAAQYDQQTAPTLGPDGSILPPPTNFSPWSVTLQVRPSPTVSGNFSFDYDTRFDAVLFYRASTSINQPVFDLTGSWTKQQVIPGLNPYAAHALSFSTRLKKPNGGGSVAYSTAVDIVNDRFLQHQVSAYYNAQCCGVSVDYTVRNLSHLGRRNDKLFSISFSLAGIGSFANPMGVFGNRR